MAEGNGVPGDGEVAVRNSVELLKQVQEGLKRSNDLEGSSRWNRTAGSRRKLSPHVSNLATLVESLQIIQGSARKHMIFRYSTCSNRSVNFGSTAIPS